MEAGLKMRDRQEPTVSISDAVVITVQSKLQAQMLTDALIELNLWCMAKPLEANVWQVFARTKEDMEAACKRCGWL